LPGAWAPYMLNEPTESAPLTPGRAQDVSDNGSRSTLDSDSLFPRQNPAEIKNIREDASGVPHTTVSSGAVATRRQSPPSSSHESHSLQTSENFDQGTGHTTDFHGLKFSRRDIPIDPKAPFNPPERYKPYRKSQDPATTDLPLVDSPPSSQPARNAPIGKTSQGWIPPVKTALNRPPSNFAKADASRDPRTSPERKVVFHPPNRTNSLLSSTSPRTSQIKQANHADASFASKARLSTTQTGIINADSSAQFQRGFRPPSTKPPMGPQNISQIGPSQTSSELRNTPAQGSGFIPPSSFRRPSKSPDSNGQRPPVKFIPPSSKSSTASSTKVLHTSERSQVVGPFKLK
jgi:hypothetical protein